jgi:formylglycine-generating enzyme required for sulfatase activity/transcriptional regulator with XRE-family HTH domain
MTSELGAFIRDRRLELGLAQKDLADAVSLRPVSLLARFERGEAPVSAILLRRLAEALAVPVDSLRSLRDATAQAGGNRGDVSPYRGLQSFREVDAWAYFGRTASVNRLLSKLEHTQLVGVVGSSGSGKSSLVAAGLLPALRRTHDVHVIRMRPGRKPFEALAVAATQVLHQRADPADVAAVGAVASALEDGKGYLLFEQIRQQLPSDALLLVLVDQFEELFAQCDDEHVRSAFIRLLFDLSAGHGPLSGGTRVVITLRSDFFHYVVNSRQLADAAQDGLVYLSPMSAEELREAIVNPAAMHGLSIEDELVNRIIEDAGDEPGRLPLVQYCLSILHTSPETTNLTIKSYEALGGLDGAVASQAERVYSARGRDGQAAMRRVMSRLVKVGAGDEGTETRRRLPYDIVAESPQERDVIESLVAARLLTTDFDEGEQTNTVELAHEAIIRNWDRLRSWILEDRGFLLWQQTVEPIAAEWDRAEQDPAYVLRGRLLQHGQEWAEQRLSDMRPAVQAFLKASIAAAAAEAAARSEEVASFLLRARPEDISDLVAALRSNRSWVASRLRALIEEESEHPNVWRLRLSLVADEPMQLEALFPHLMICQAAELAPIVGELAGVEADLRPSLVGVLNRSNVDDGKRLRAAAALAQLGIVTEEERAAFGAAGERVAATLVDENPLHMLAWTNAFASATRLISPHLERLLASEEVTYAARNAAGLVLLQLHGEDPVELARIALDCDMPLLERYFSAVEAGDDVRGLVTTSLGDFVAGRAIGEPSPTSASRAAARRATAAVVLARLGDMRRASPLFRFEQNPTAATRFIHSCREMGVKALDLAAAIRSEADEHVQYCVALSLGEFDHNEVSDSRLIDHLLEGYAADPSPAVHGAYGWLLTQWGYTTGVAEVDRATVDASGPNLPLWFTLDGPIDPLPFTRIDPGNFPMGSTLDEPGAKPYETPVRTVTLSKVYAVCAREVTRAEYALFVAETGADPLPDISDFSRTGRHPVVDLTWNEANHYLEWLQTKILPGQTLPLDTPRTRRLRLPTEAQWERACRAGTTTPYSFGRDVGWLSKYAWFASNSNFETHPYRTLRPNLLGLFNMHGNCWEWCADNYVPYADGDVVDPCVDGPTELRVLRGGCWNLHERYSRSACRNWHVPTNRNYYIGLRVVMEL